jgi:hypothetical protein
MRERLVAIPVGMHPLQLALPQRNVIAAVIQLALAGECEKCRPRHTGGLPHDDRRKERPPCGILGPIDRGEHRIQFRGEVGMGRIDARNRRDGLLRCPLAGSRHVPQLEGQGRMGHTALNSRPVR